MWDFEIGRTFGLMVKTLPFILMRLGVAFTVTLAYVVATGGAAGIGYGLGHISSDPGGPDAFAVGGGFIGFGLVSGLVYWFREYVLYIVKAGHIAVLVKLIDGEAIPGGQGQIAYARAVVTERFAESNVLFGLDQLIKAAMRAITGLIGGIASFLPIPGLQSLVGFLNTVVKMSLTHVDEIVLGRIIRSNSANPFETARQGVVLYGQNAKIMIKNAVWLSLIMWVLSLVVFVLMIAPAGALLWMFPGQAGGWAFAVALIFAWAVKSALMEPFAIAALMSVYFKVTEGQTPDPVWDRRLMEASKPFRDLAGKAADWVRGTRAA